MTDIRSKARSRRSPKQVGMGEPGGVLPFPHVTGYWVNRLAASMRTAIDRELKAYDLTRRQVGMLIQVERVETELEHAPSASDLTRLLGVDSTAVTRMIDRLEEKGLVERSPDPDDGRRHLVYLTRSAKALMPKLKATARGVESEFEANVSQADLETFQKVLMRMLENVGDDVGGKFLND